MNAQKGIIRGTLRNSRAAKQTCQSGVASMSAGFSLVVGTGSSHVTRRPGCRDFPERSRRIHDNPLERGSGRGAEFKSSVPGGIGAVVSQVFGLASGLDETL